MKTWLFSVQRNLFLETKDITFEINIHFKRNNFTRHFNEIKVFVTLLTPVTILETGDNKTCKFELHENQKRWFEFSVCSILMKSTQKLLKKSCARTKFSNFCLSIFFVRAQEFFVTATCRTSFIFWFLSIVAPEKIKVFKFQRDFRGKYGVRKIFCIFWRSTHRF